MPQAEIPQMARAGDPVRSPIHGRPRRLHRECGPSLHRTGTALLGTEPPLGAQRLHPAVRRIPDARRPCGRQSGASRACSSSASACSHSSSVCGLATGSRWLVAARAVQGLGASIAVTCGSLDPDRHLEEGHRRNRALRFRGAIAGAGGAFGVLLGGPDPGSGMAVDLLRERADRSTGSRRQLLCSPAARTREGPWIRHTGRCDGHRQLQPACLRLGEEQRLGFGGRSARSRHWRHRPSCSWPSCSSKGGRLLHLCRSRSSATAVSRRPTWSRSCSARRSSRCSISLPLHAAGARVLRTQNRHRLPRASPGRSSWLPARRRRWWRRSASEPCWPSACSWPRAAVYFSQISVHRKLRG